VSYHSDLMIAGADLVFDVLGDENAAVYTPADGSAAVTFSRVIVGAVTTDREEDALGQQSTTKRRQVCQIRVPAAEFDPPQLAGQVVVNQHGELPWGIRRIVEHGEQWVALELERAEAISFQRRGVQRRS
jgi:hypothetical protein